MNKYKLAANIAVLVVCTIFIVGNFVLSFDNTSEWSKRTYHLVLSVFLIKIFRGTIDDILEYMEVYKKESHVQRESSK